MTTGVSLVPVGSWILRKENLIGELVSWRSRYSRSFFAEVPATSSSMRSYLRKYAIGDTSRILFLILQDGTLSGHIGLANISRASAELDNVVRGRQTYPGMMHEVVEFLKTWAREELGLSVIYLRVKADNKAAIALYCRSGFQRVDGKAPNIPGNIDRFSLEASGGFLMSVGVNPPGKPGKPGC